MPWWGWVLAYVFCAGLMACSWISHLGRPGSSLTKWNWGWTAITVFTIAFWPCVLVSKFFYAMNPENWFPPLDEEEETEASATNQEPELGAPN